jgi:hypothetical protein
MPWQEREPVDLRLESVAQSLQPSRGLGRFRARRIPKRMPVPAGSEKFNKYNELYPKCERSTYAGPSVRGTSDPISARGRH